MTSMASMVVTWWFLALGSPQELLLQRGINDELTRAAAEAILGNLAAVMGSLGLEALVNCLKLMALTKQQELERCAGKSRVL